MSVYIVAYKKQDQNEHMTTSFFSLTIAVVQIVTEIY